MEQLPLALRRVGVTAAAIIFTATGLATATSAPAGASTPKITKASPPLALVGTPGDGVEVMSWGVPASDGGSAITGYVVKAVATSKTKAKKATCTATAPSTTCALSGLANGISYKTAVVAVNAKGISKASTATIVEPGLPGAPGTVTATAADSSATVSWSSAQANGSVITSYSVSAVGATQGCTYVVASPESDQCVVAGLTDGTSYTFVVAAISVVGTGAPSTPSNEVIPGTPPAAPTNVQTTGVTSSAAAVSWTAPATSSLPITGYVVAGVPQCTMTAATTCAATGLSAYTVYTACVAAVSAAGTGPQACGPTIQTLPSNAGSSLSTGRSLGVDQALFSPSGTYFAVLQPDGNFVEYRVADGTDYQYNGSSVVQWYTGTSGNASMSLAMQTDGNLVVYAGSSALWSTSTALSANDQLAMQDDGNLVVYNSAMVPLWSHVGGRTSYQGDQLPAGYQLNAGQAIYSPSGTYAAVMQGDGNFVVYAPGSVATWSTQSGGSGANTVVMQGDGNLVVYAPGRAVWSSGTAPSSNDNLTMQDDGNLVIYSGSGAALWSKNSGRITGGGGGHTAAETAAVTWALQQQGLTTWDGLCLEFVYLAYTHGGVDIRNFASIPNTNAATYWNTTNLTRHTDASPPYGALVFWGARPGYPDGHVAISLGDGTAVSTYERNVYGVHVFSLSARASYNYVGWLSVG